MGLFRKPHATPAGSIGTDLPLWPSGMARFADGFFEVTTVDGLRVPAGDILAIGMEPPLRGRLLLIVSFRSGLINSKRSFWVDTPHEGALRELVHAVGASIGTS